MEATNLSQAVVDGIARAISRELDAREARIVQTVKSAPHHATLSDVERGMMSAVSEEVDRRCNAVRAEVAMLRDDVKALCAVLAATGDTSFEALDVMVRDGPEAPAIAGRKH